MLVSLGNTALQNKWFVVTSNTVVLRTIVLEEGTHVGVVSQGGVSSRLDVVLCTCIHITPLSRTDTYKLCQKKELCFRSSDRPYQNRANPTFLNAILKKFIYFHTFLGQF